MMILFQNNIHFFIFSLFLAMGTACTHGQTKPEIIHSTTSHIQKETQTSQFTQREFLTRTLELMANTSSIQELNREKIEQFFGIQMKQHPDEKEHYVFIDKLTDNWAQGLKFHKTLFQEQVFTLSFNTFTTADKNAKLNEICEMGFDEFIQLAETKGFTKKPMIMQDAVTHGYYLDKNNLHLAVIPEFYLDIKTVERNCIKMIIVR